MAAFIGGCIVYGVNRYLFGGNADLSIFIGLLTSMWIHANEMKYEIRKKLIPQSSAIAKWLFPKWKITKEYGR